MCGKNETFPQDENTHELLARILFFYRRHLLLNWSISEIIDRTARERERLEIKSSLEDIFQIRNRRRARSSHVINIKRGKKARRNDTKKIDRSLRSANGGKCLTHDLSLIYRVGIRVKQYRGKRKKKYEKYREYTHD